MKVVNGKYCLPLYAQKLLWEKNFDQFRFLGNYPPTPPLSQH